MKLIDKDKVVAEIQRTKDFYENIGQIRPVYDSNIADCEELLSFLDTLEVKDADCDMEIGIYTTKELLKKRNHSTGVFHLTQTDINSIAKHFYELGLKAKKGE